MKGWHRIVVWIAPLAGLLLLGRCAVPPKDEPGTMRLVQFGKLPVVHHGRVKPMDTLARNSLVILADRQTFRDEENEKHPAIEWLADTISQAPAAREHRVFRIPNLDVLQLLGLERRKGFRYAYGEFSERIDDLEAQARQITSLRPEDRDAYANAVTETWNKVRLFETLIEVHLIPEVRPESAEEDLRNLAAYYQDLSRSPLPHVIPPTSQDDEWRPYLEALLFAVHSGQRTEPLADFTAMLVARNQGDVAAFNAALDRYEAWLAANPPPDTPDMDKLSWESFYNQFQPFYACLVLYVVAFVLGCLSWLGAGEVFRRSAFLLMIVTFGAHVFALGLRVHISGYPPVTNLYGSAVFIGAGCVALGLLLERLFPLGVGNLVAAVTGFLTLLIAHFLSLDGDTMEMMRAVLDTKFWLATHVITITLGYTATFFAGGLAILYLVRGIFTRSLTPRIENTLGRMMYGVIAFALLLSFVGTVLGGLWADDSWGRFWGWDPKENGALMIVLWNALALHSRWAGLVRVRGLAALAVGGNIVTAWSWFGVNQLGIGLHSYGFIDSVAFWLGMFVLSQIGILGLGLLPRRLWRSSFATMRAAPPPPAAKPREEARETAPTAGGGR